MNRVMLFSLKEKVVSHFEVMRLDGRFDQKALDGWALETRDFFGVGDLCPECFKVYRETMERFYTGGKHGA